MREIKFRAWDKEKEFWLDQEHFYITGEGVGFTCEDSKGMFSNIYRRMGTDRYTLEQYTGPEDKNNTEGWDGMIVKAKHKRTGEEMVGPIVWHDQNFAWGVQLKEWIMPLDILINHFDFEFIGNIHDNPELTENGL